MQFEVFNKQAEKLNITLTWTSHCHLWLLRFTLASPTNAVNLKVNPNVTQTAYRHFENLKKLRRWTNNIRQHQAKLKTTCTVENSKVVDNKWDSGEGPEWMKMVETRTLVYFHTTRSDRNISFMKFSIDWNISSHFGRLMAHKSVVTLTFAHNLIWELDG